MPHGGNADLLELAGMAPGPWPLAPGPWKKGPRFWAPGPMEKLARNVKKNLERPPRAVSIHLRFSSLLREYTHGLRQSARCVFKSRKRRPDSSLRDGIAVAMGPSTGFESLRSASALPGRPCVLELHRNLHRNHIATTSQPHNLHRNPRVRDTELADYARAQSSSSRARFNYLLLLVCGDKGSFLFVTR